LYPPSAGPEGAEMEKKLKILSHHPENVSRLRVRKIQYKFKFNSNSNLKYFTMCREDRIKLKCTRRRERVRDIGVLMGFYLIVLVD
jgi:hypothetical protein